MTQQRYIFNYTITKWRLGATLASSVNTTGSEDPVNVAPTKAPRGAVTAKATIYNVNNYISQDDYWLSQNFLSTPLQKI